MQGTHSGQSTQTAQKLEHWKRRLLDLSGRNNLVNYHETSRTLRISSPDLAGAIKELEQETPIRVAQRRKARRWVVQETARTGESSGDRRTNEDTDDPAQAALRKRVSRLYLKARDHFQEQGLSTCFAAVGMVTIKEQQMPVLLQPLELSRGSPEKDSIDISFTPVEELGLNPALREKLHHEHRITLPAYAPQQGDGPVAYLDAVAKAIAPLDGTLEQSVLIDIFSYQKHIMVDDLTTHAQLAAKNPLVRAFAGEGLEQKQPLVRDESIDLLPADSSQKHAIEMAKAGLSFVLQGPPGTGKSQTVANIIAASMLQGKKVLFVSQKMAALNVVHQRLEQAGLGRYCLNLHNYKEQKKTVIEQLMQELLTSPRIPDDAMRYSFAPYEGLAKELNEYYQWLCEPRKPWNISVYELRGSLAVREHVHLIEQPLTSTLKLDASGFAQMLEQVRLLDEIMQRIGVPFENPYWHFKKGGRGIESGMQHALASAAQALRSLATFIEGLPCKATTFAQLEALASISRELQALRAPHWLLTNISDEQPRLARLHALHERKAALRSSLLSMVTTRFLSQQMPSGLRCPWWRRLFSSEYRTARAALRPFAIRRMSHGSWIRAFSLLEEHRQIEKDISKESAKSRHYQATSASVVGKYHRMAEKAGALREQASALGSADAILQHLAKANADIVGEFRQKAGDVNWFFSKEVFPLVTVKSAGSALGQLQNLLGTLTDCIAFRDTYGKLDAEVSGFVNAAAADTSGKGTAACFVKAYHHQALAQVMRTNARNAPKELAERYRKEDHKVRDMHRYRIMATIEAAQPKQHYHTSGGTSEVAILKREHEKKRKLKPIRSLLSSMPNLAFALKPCFMMSPLTVSQYIDPEKIQFDMVIFDEASQIMPEDALPALMRAKQAIIMGDTQQLPPTSFFQKDNEDTIATGAGSGSATEIIDDLDSFLAEATTTFPEFSLLWHYRSRDERLIAFSNQQFYNSRLITFPQCGGAGGVSVVHVKGAYERGGSRMNLREAEKVAELFIEERKKNASIGLIAFSVQQERAIREALEARGVTLDESIDPSSEEPFIKNLETVQGDERDIIIISVGYAHDAAGRLTLNFGPLNQEGGYKRLNVAVTRARVKTIMVTGLSPQDLAHAKGQGPKVLHDYLAYAHQVRHGGAVAAHQRIATHTRGDGVRTDDTLLLDDFQQSVHDALRRQYQIDTLVGRSGYRLDFALKDKKGDSYVLGVECDGSFYRAAPLARDRDKVRHELLLSLGWTLYRVYSEDWIVSREHVMDSVKESLGRRQTAEASKDDAAEHPTGKDGFAKVRSVKTFSEIPLRERYSSYQQARLPRYGKARFAERSGAVMRQVLETEGIVHEEYLLSRVRGAFGVANTQVARAALKDTLRRMGAQRSGHSVWLRGDTAPVVRVSTEQQRAFKWVPKEELALAVQDVLSINMSMTEEDLARDVIAGIYGRTATAAAKRQVHDAVVSLEKAGKLTREGSGKSATLRIR